MTRDKLSHIGIRKWFTDAILAALVMALLLFPCVSRALTFKQKALVGLRGVYVEVEDMEPKAMDLGLTKDQIKTDIELRLRKAGVKVLTKEEMYETPGMPSLYVNINTVFDSPLVYFSINVELQEMVTLDRGFKTEGSIWDTGIAGGVRTSNIRQIREHMGDGVDRFINDYLAANPK